MAKKTGSNMVEFEFSKSGITRETDRAVKLGADTWLPKSKIEIVPAAKDGLIIVRLPQWLVEAKGIEGWLNRKPQKPEAPKQASFDMQAWARGEAPKKQPQSARSAELDAEGKRQIEGAKALEPALLSITANVATLEQRAQELQKELGVVLAGLRALRTLGEAA